MQAQWDLVIIGRTSQISHQHKSQRFVSKSNSSPARFLPNMMHKIKVWILAQLGIEFVPVQLGLRLVTGGAS